MMKTIRRTTRFSECVPETKWVFRRVVLIIATVFFCTCPSVLGQNSEQPDVNEPTAGNFFGIGARAMAMGGAYIAVANDAAALVYNPAGLARVTRIEFSGGLTHQRLKNKTGSFQLTTPHFNHSFLQSNTRFGSANVVLPVPTYRGSLVLALGVNRVVSFDRSLEYVNIERQDSATRSESGGLYAWSFGGAIDLSPQISVGAAFNLLRGKYDYALLADSSYDRGQVSWSYRWNDVITDRYSGWNVKLGTRMQPNRFLVIGATVETPLTYTIEEDWSQITDTIFHSPYKPPFHDAAGDLYEYKFTLPFSMGLGIALNLKNMIVAADMNYADWTQMEYKRLVDKPDANRVIRQVYKDVVRWHIGAEYRIARIGTSLRAGYFQNPFPFKSAWIKSDRRFITAGVGFLIDQVVTLDLAFVHGSWETNDFSKDLASRYIANQIFLTVAYRL